MRIKAVSVNPVDVKVRGSSSPADAAPKIIGFDAAGVVEAVGAEVSLFKAGDEVFYAGDITRQGTNAELHVVDERIVGHKPKSLDWAQAAVLPLTSITAWELLFDRLRAPYGSKKSGGALLVIIDHGYTQRGGIAAPEGNGVSWPVRDPIVLTNVATTDTTVWVGHGPK